MQVTFLQFSGSHTTVSRSPRTDDRKAVAYVSAPARPPCRAFNEHGCNRPTFPVKRNAEFEADAGIAYRMPREEAEHPVGVFQIIDNATPPIVAGLDAAFVPPYLVNFDLQFGQLLPKPFLYPPRSCEDPWPTSDPAIERAAERIAALPAW
jgi:hypothetical protein